MPLTSPLDRDLDAWLPNLKLEDGKMFEWLAALRAKVEALNDATAPALTADRLTQSDGLGLLIATPFTVNGITIGAASGGRIRMQGSAGALDDTLAWLDLNNAAGTRLGYTNDDLFEAAVGQLTLLVAGGIGVRTFAGGDTVIGPGSLATTATQGFLYVGACAGAPTGVPGGRAGYIPIVINSTTHKLMFYSGGAWRDAGP